MKRYLCLTFVFALLIFSLVGCKITDNKTAYSKKDLQYIQSALIASEYEKNTSLVKANRFIDEEKYAFDQERLEKKLEETVKKFHKECGKIKSIKKDTKYDYVSGEINVVTTLDCTKRDATVTSIFKYDEENKNKLTLYEMTFDPIYTTGEKLSQAGANTAIGMGTVFAVLIFIFLVISCFNLFPKVQKVIKRKKKMDKGPRSFETVQKSKDEMDDNELVAVITAAIASTEKKSTDSFIVRSIKRR